MSIIKILCPKAIAILVHSCVPIDVLGLQQKNCLVGTEKIRLSELHYLTFDRHFLLSGSF